MQKQQQKNNNKKKKKKKKKEICLIKLQSYYMFIEISKI